MKHLLGSLLLLLFTLYHSTAFSSNLKIMTTIRPIYALVESVTDGILKPLLLPRTTSLLHDHTLKPSDASNLESSDIIFYVDDNLETFIKTFAKKNKKLVQLSKAVNLLPARPHSFSRHISNIQKEKDLHIWLNPENAKDIILFINDTLSSVDGKNSYRYNQNAAKAIKRIEQETEKITKELDELKNKKYIVTHDAYQYFEKYFGLNCPSVILSIEEDSYIGMRSLMKLRKIVKEENIKCIFSSSQKYNTKLKSVSDNVKIEIIDPIGSSEEIKPGKDSYIDIISNITQNFKSCLSL